MKAHMPDTPFQLDQERLIMQQIHDINKKLSANSHSAKNINSSAKNVYAQSATPPPSYSAKIALSKISVLQPQQDPEQKYFSQQCDDLFADHNFPSRPQLSNPLEESLFNSNNSLLLGNQFEKQVKNFPQFCTNGENLLHSANNLKLIHAKELIKGNGYDSRQKQTQNSQSGARKNSQNLLSQKVMSKSSSQASLKKKNPGSKIQLNQKVTQGQHHINKLIENKENIQNNLNHPQNSFIKSIKNKIRFETQPDQYTLTNQYLECFQSGKEQKADGFIVERVSKNKQKSNYQNSTFQCTFKPSILKKSHEIAQNLQPSFERLTQEITISKSQSKLPYKAKQQLTDKKYSVKRLEQLSQPRKQKQATDREQPTYDFRPTLSKKSLSQMANCTMDVASRNKLWLQQKEAKITKLKEEEEEKKLKKETGSFAPKITPYKGQNQVHLSRFTKQGISSYFERVSMAKQRTQAIEKKKPIPREQVKEVNVVMKKKTYDEAVKELHKKILTMNI